jgi:hypothetical protein
MPAAQAQAALQPTHWTAPAHGVADAGVAVAGCCWQHDREGAGQRVGQLLAWVVHVCRLCKVAGKAGGKDASPQRVESSESVRDTMIRLTQAS